MRAHAKLAPTVLSQTLLREGEQLDSVAVGFTVSCDVAQRVAKVAKRTADVTCNHAEHTSPRFAVHRGRMGTGCARLSEAPGVTRSVGESHSQLRELVFSPGHLETS